MYTGCPDNIRQLSKLPHMIQIVKPKYISRNTGATVDKSLGKQAKLPVKRSMTVPSLCTATSQLRISTKSKNEGQNPNDTHVSEQASVSEETADIDSVSCQSIQNEETVNLNLCTGNTGIKEIEFTCNTYEEKKIIAISEIALKTSHADKSCFNKVKGNRRKHPPLLRQKSVSVASTLAHSVKSFNNCLKYKYYTSALCNSSFYPKTSQDNSAEGNREMEDSMASTCTGVSCSQLHRINTRVISQHWNTLRSSVFSCHVKPLCRSKHSS